MCYKFTYDAEVEYDLSTFASFISENIERHHGEVLPSQPSPVVTQWCQTPNSRWCQTPNEKQLGIDVMKWGFTGADERLLINARSETVMQKPTFAESFAERRCIVPAHAFFERNLRKEEVRFERPCRKISEGKAAAGGSSEEKPDCGILYMAGIYRKEQGVWRFTVLTTEPHPSLRQIHDRMPLLLPRDLIEPWICDAYAAMEILKTPAPELVTYQNFEQLTLL